MSRTIAATITIGGAFLLILSIAASWNLPPLEELGSTSRGKQTDKSDTRFYRDIVAKVRGGQSYYDAVRDEFALPVWSPRGFRPTSVFNWRLPTYAWLLAALPNPAPRMLLTILAFAGALLAFKFARAAGPTAGSLTVLLIGPLAWCTVGEVFYFAELWAGALILISLCASGTGHWKVGVVAGIAALLFRELSLVYCGMMLCTALARRRRAEAAVWMAGFLLFALLFAYHIRMVSAYMPATSRAFDISAWLRFSGLPFLLRSVQVTNIFLILLPAWASAVWLTAGLIGLAGQQDPTGRVTFSTALAYAAMIAVLGAPGTYYWGLMMASLLSLGVAFLPSTLRQIRAAFASQSGAARRSPCAAEHSLSERF